MEKFLVVKCPHFLDRLFRSPSIKRNPVRRHEHPIAISAKPAVYENLSPWSFTRQCKKLCHLLIPRRRPASPWNAHQPYSQRLRMRAFFLHQAVPFSAQINDGVNSQLLQLLDSFLFRLRPAIQILIHLPEVLNSKNSHFLCKRVLMWRRSSALPRGTPAANLHKNEQQKRRNQSVVMHG